jgi:hypothetical protein
VFVNEAWTLLNSTSPVEGYTFSYRLKFCWVEKWKILFLGVAMLAATVDDFLRPNYRAIKRFRSKTDLGAAKSALRAEL